MRTRSLARLTALVGIAALVAGCSPANGTGDGDGDGDGSLAQVLQLRLVTSSTAGPCSAPLLTSDAAGGACDRARTTTYEVGESLGEVTPTAVTLPEDQGSGPAVEVELDEAGASTLGKVTRDAVGKRLAILLEGRVLSAALVMEPIGGNELTIGTGTASEAVQVASALGVPATS